MAKPADRPAKELLPGFQGLCEKFEEEVRGLTDAQVNFKLPSKGWGLWSIQDQLSHVASVNYRWLLERWGKVLAARGHRLRANAEALYDVGDSDRMLDPKRYPTFSSIMGALKDSFALVEEVVGKESEKSLRAESLTRRVGPGDRLGRTQEDAYRRHYEVTLKAHARGIWNDPADAHLWHYDLDWTLRHIYWEALAHLYTIQKLKEAQSLKPKVQVPREGYVAVQVWEWGGRPQPSPARPRREGRVRDDAQGVISSAARNLGCPEGAWGSRSLRARTPRRAQGCAPRFRPLAKHPRPLAPPSGSRPSGRGSG